MSLKGSVIRLSELVGVEDQRKMSKLIMITNTAVALGVSSYPVFSVELPCPLWEGARRNQTCLVKAGLPLSKSDFPWNLEFQVGNASLSVGLSLELGTCIS